MNQFTAAFSSDPQLGRKLTFSGPGQCGVKNDVHSADIMMTVTESGSTLEVQCSTGYHGNGHPSGTSKIFFQ